MIRRRLRRRLRRRRRRRRRRRYRCVKALPREFVDIRQRSRSVRSPFARFQARSRRRRRGRRGRRRSSGYRTVTPRRGAAHRAAVRLSRVRASIFIGTKISLASRVVAIPLELVASARASLRSLVAPGTRCDPSGVQRVSSPSGTLLPSLPPSLTLLLTLSLSLSLFPSNRERTRRDVAAGSGPHDHSHLFRALSPRCLAVFWDCHR